jgi:hypothetical protein
LLESLDISELLGMTNIISSLMALSSIYHCCAYDSELSSYAIRLAHESLCLIDYAIYMFRLVDLSYGGGSSSILVMDALVEDS